MNRRRYEPLGADDPIGTALAAVTRELRVLGLWGGEAGRPPAAALASALPFGLDRLAFHQWLEYVLIPRAAAAAASGARLPSPPCVHPVAEVLYAGRPEYAALTQALRDFDAGWARLAAGRHGTCSKNPADEKLTDG